MRLIDLFENRQQVITLWHGGRSLESDYREVRGHKKGQWEHGPGLYLTTHLDTATKYAKGGGKLYRVSVVLGRNIDDVSLDFKDAVAFVNRYTVARKRKIMIDDLQNSLQRMGHLPAETLVNLCLNHEALPSSRTDRLRQFLIDNGVDYARTRYGGRNETVVVVINPRIIQKVEVVRPRDIDSSEYVQTITEAPIANFDYIDRSQEMVKFASAKEPLPRDNSFRDDDRKALQSPKWRAKVIHAFRNTPEPFNVYAVNAKWLTVYDSSYDELGGRMQPGQEAEKPYQQHIKADYIDDLKSFSGPYRPNDFKNTFGFLPPNYENSLNFVLVQNEGDERVPMTPWMLAHRIVHALLNEQTRGFYNSEYRGSFQRAFKRTQEAFAEVIDAAGIWNLNGAVAQGERMDKLRAEVATMKSAKLGKIKRPGEFYIELMTQYLLKGDFDFNFEHLVKPHKHEMVNHDLQEAKRFMDEGFQAAIGCLIVF